MRDLDKVVIVTYITHGLTPDQNGEVRVASTNPDFPLTVFRYKTRDERVEFLESLQRRLDVDGMSMLNSCFLGMNPVGSQIVRIYAPRVASGAGTKAAREPTSN